MKDRVQGKVEEIRGRVAGRKRLELKGKARQKVGSLKESVKAIAYDAEHPPRKS